ncbi:MAG: glycosyltransferase [Candidatus Binatia bacterium]
MSLSDFLFRPARYERFGLAIMEALAYGFPVIVASVGVMDMIDRDQPFHALLRLSTGRLSTFAHNTARL